MDNARIAVIGLGHVGLPLALAFGRHFDVTGFDIRTTRIDELRAGSDHTREMDPADLAAAPRVHYTADLEALRACNVFLITVPTPIDEYKRPDFGPLIEASRSVGRVLKGIVSRSLVDGRL